MVPTSATAAAQRRLAVLVVLMALAAVTLAATFMVSRSFMLVNLAVDAVLVIYGYLLWNRASQMSRQRRSALTTLPTRRSGPMAVENDNVMPLRARAKGA